MVIKRPLSSTPSPAKKRKINIDANDAQQGSLDSFFKRSPQKGASESEAIPQQASSSKLPTENSESDETFAKRLAAEDGLDIETIRRLETGWKRGPIVAPRYQMPEIVIDVDNILQTEPSDTTGENADPLRRQSSTKELRDVESTPPPRTSPIARMTAKYSLLADVRDDYVDITLFPDLNADPLSFSVSDCAWGTTNSPTPYSFLTHTLCSLSTERSRIALINILTNALRFIIRHDVSALLPALYLLSNSLAPPYVPVELGLGPSIISKAIQHVSGLTPAALKRLYNRMGDAGDVAFEARSNLRTLVPHPALTVSGVFDSLLKICHSKGEGTAKQKQSIVEKLLVAARGEEVRFLVRTMGHHIRVGAVRTSILTALARAMVLTRPPGQNNLDDSSPFFATAESIALVEKVAMKGKKKDGDDPTRERILAKFTDAEGLVKRVYVQHPNYDHIVECLIAVGLEGLSEHVLLTVGIPLRPTLGSPTRSLDEIYDRLGNLPFAAEFKYDGQRAQIHAWKSGDDAVHVKLFSRHLEEMTDKYPDVISLVDIIFERSDIISFVMDTEIVAINPADGSLRTFQELSNRARKGVRLEDIKINVCVFAFDLMYLNGTSLLEQPFRSRRQQLRNHFPTLTPGTVNIARFAHVESCESEAGRDALEEFWRRAVEGRSEGLMVKLLDSGEVFEDTSNAKVKPRRKPLPATYEPDKRTSAWLKLKKDYVLGVGDSLDLVPIGAWHGNGRKAAWWSPILLAIWDEDSGQFVGICKCMSGFTDEFYKALTVRYPEGSESCSRTSKWNINTGGLKPEVYFKPQEVWEVRGADITQSPVSVAALGHVSESRGLSLRFPRFIRPRNDKGIMDASSPAFLATMWRNQENKGKFTEGIDDGDLVDISPEASEVDEEEYEL